MDTLRDQKIKIFLIVVGYWYFCMIYFKLDFPLFITWVQCLITVGCLFFLEFWSKFFTRPIKVYFYRPLFFVSLCFVGMITFNNLTLKITPVSFYNILRALSTVFNLIFTYFLLGQKISLRSVLCCAVVIVGYLFGIADSQFFADSYSCIIVGVLASLFVSLFAIYTQSGLSVVDKNPWMFQTFVNMNAMLIIAPMLPITGETSLIFHYNEDIRTLNAFFTLLLSGILGFLIGIFTTLQIKYTSALTHNVSGTAKSCAQTIIAVLVNSEIHSFIWWLGSFLVLVGSGLYSYVRNQEMNESFRHKTVRGVDNSNV